MKIAVLIDGDNAESSLIEQILEEAGKFGRVTIKRIYADWTKTTMRGWKRQLNSHAVKPIQKFQYTRGKNSTDTALIIDAMDILHAKLVDAFCLVSSDSDFTGLAHRIREEGLKVVGIGRSHTPIAFVKACDDFTYTEILAPEKPVEVEVETKKKPTTTRTKKTKTTTPKAVPKTKKVKETLPPPPLLTNKVTKKPIDMKIIESSYERAVDQDVGMALLSRFSDSLRQADPSFDPRNYGCSNFRKFCAALNSEYKIVTHKDKMTLSITKLE